jgi:hypothetical protein
VRNCTIANNSGVSTTDGLNITGGTVTLTNNIFANNQRYGINISSVTLTHTYNDFYNNTSGNFNGASASTGEITTNPQFTNSGTADYSLLYGSPAIDTGTTIGAITTDILGAARPLGAGYDMGCYEHDPSGDPVIGIHILKWQETQ